MKMRLSFILAFVLRWATADIFDGAMMQLTCTGIENNKCFDNQRNPKYKAILQMIETKLLMVYDGDMDPVPPTRKLQGHEEEEESGPGLRGSNRQLQNVCAGCFAPGNGIQFICQLLGCYGRRAMLETAGDTCKVDVNLSTYLVDFPTKPIENCLEGVSCELEYFC